MSTPLVISLSVAGNKVAQTIAADLDADYAGHPMVRPVRSPADQIRSAFVKGRTIVGVCATGIMCRILASVIVDKAKEPPVLAVSSDGAHVVPVLGGHHGGNALADRISRLTGGIAAITTASESVLGIALDAPPEGWALAPNQDVKSAAARLLAGEKIKLLNPVGWLEDSGLVARNGTVRIAASPYLAPVAGADITYVPKSIMVGVGCSRGCGADEILDLVNQQLDNANINPAAVAAFGSIDIKSDEIGLLEAAAEFGVPLQLFGAAELVLESSKVPNPSPLVEAETGTPAVAEAVASKAGEIIAEKAKSAMATCAIGLSGTPIDLRSFGRPVGQLQVVGIGPGDPAFRTAQAVAVLKAATDWVGYDLYLDLINDLRKSKEEHRFGLGAEEDRVRLALELAGSGKRVALVCSGDPGIFAMAALAGELVAVDEGERVLTPAARRVAVEIVPGISAFQLAAARAGAPVGHDFCCISLSDLLTPRDSIEKRILAAAEADLVTCLYNPRSGRRTELLDWTLSAFRQHRRGDTPVVIARNLGRADERVETVALENMDAASVDMLTIVIIGNSETRTHVRRNGTQLTYTPRGYARKANRA